MLSREWMGMREFNGTIQVGCINHTIANLTPLHSHYNHPSNPFHCFSVPYEKCTQKDGSKSWGDLIPWFLPRLFGGRDWQWILCESMMSHTIQSLVRNPKIPTPKKIETWETWKNEVHYNPHHPGITFSTSLWGANDTIDLTSFLCKLKVQNSLFLISCNFETILCNLLTILPDSHAQGPPQRTLKKCPFPTKKDTLTFTTVPMSIVFPNIITMEYIFQFTVRNTTIFCWFWKDRPQVWAVNQATQAAPPVSAPGSPGRTQEISRAIFINGSNAK